MKPAFKLSIVTIAATAAVLVGCGAPRRAASRPSGIVIKARFDAAQASALLAKGEGSIKGNAFLRLRNGSVVTCAGADVALIPATKYAEEGMKAAFGSDARKTAFRNWYAINNVRFAVNSDSENFRKNTRHTQCDSRGDFIFENVANGDFFVVTEVTWVAADRRQGGKLIKRVSVKDGETVSVIMSR